MTWLGRLVWTLMALLICSVPCTVARDDWQRNGGAASDKHTGASAVMSSPTVLTGHWEGIWLRSGAAGGALTAVLMQSDSSLAGEVEILDAPCLPGGIVSGSVNGATVVFGVVLADAVQAEFEGTISDDGLTITGSYKVISGKCVEESGNWHVVKIIAPCDANGDGTVDRQDARDLLDVLLGGGGPLLGDADCNQDGVLDFRDVIAILKAASM